MILPEPPQSIPCQSHIICIVSSLNNNSILIHLIFHLFFSLKNPQRMLLWILLCPCYNMTLFPPTWSVSPLPALTFFQIFIGLLASFSYLPPTFVSSSPGVSAVHSMVSVDHFINIYGFGFTDWRHCSRESDSFTVNMSIFGTLLRSGCFS